VNSLIESDILGRRYNIYKLKSIGRFDYFKVNDLLDFDKKYALEPILVKDPMPRKLIKLVKHLNHPNLLYLDYFVDDGYFYVVRPYDDDYYGFWWRLQIQKHLQANHKRIEIEEGQIVYWLKHLLLAVDALHQNNILHKFIVPRAISFKQNQLKLFVPAKSVVLESEDHALIEDVTWYKCPENHGITEEQRAIGLSYDIWSVGWTLYEICTLTDPRQMLEDVKDFGKWSRPDLPRFYTRDLDRLFKLMTIIDQEQRFTAGQLLEQPIFQQFDFEDCTE